MRRILVFAVLTLAASSLASGQSPDRQTGQDERAGSTSQSAAALLPGGSAKQEIVKLSAELDEASGGRDFRHFDPEAFDRLTADDFVHVQYEGTFTKAESLANLRAPAAAARDPKTFMAGEATRLGRRVYVFGDTAVVITDTKFKVQQGGEIIEDTNSVTTVWARRSGRWQAVLNNDVSRGRPKHSATFECFGRGRKRSLNL